MSARRFLWFTAGFAAALSLIFLLVRQRNFDPLDRYAAEIDASISAARIGQEIQALAAKPHRAGTAQNKIVGDAILRRLQQMGLEVSTSEYTVSLYEPVETRLILTAPDSLKEFDLREKVLAEDPYSQVAVTEIPYFAFSPDADLEAEVLYANFGTRDDYELLKKQGIQVAGKIALVRAQGICRSMKAQVAEEERVAGLLLFPELRDEGFRKPSYPQGPNVNPWVAQRGSLLKYYVYPGEPSTDSTIPKVPAIPVTEETAIEILKRIQGTPAPLEWRGWLPVQYLIGSGPARARMIVRGTLRRQQIRNLFATIPASNKVETSVMVGTHYDAWVHGASDPVSGVAILLEAAETLAHLRKKDWAPRRTITFAFFDAEEFGMYGSTKWVEQNLQQVRDHLAAFLYVDSMRGRFFGGYVMPGLRSALDDVLNYVRDPDTGKLVSEVRGEYELPGFSSDTIPFTSLAGIPVADLHYGTSYPMYHSVYDDPEWMEKFCDPGYRYSANFARMLSLYLMRLTTGKIFPYRFSELTDFLSRALAQLKIELPENSPAQASLEALSGQIDQFDSVAQRWDLLASGHRELSEPAAAKVNSLLLQAASSFMEPFSHEKSISERNVLVGPSDENACNGDAFPGLRNALHSQDQRQAEAEIRKLTVSISKARQLLMQAEHLLQ